MAVKNTLLFKIFIVLNVFFITLTTLSLFSYSEKDPSFSNIIFSNYEIKVNNFFGKIGAYYADILGNIFGWASFILPFLLIFISIGLFYKTVERHKKVKRFIFDLILSFSFISFLALFSGFLSDSDPIFKEKHMGGIIGNVAATFLQSILGKYGGALSTAFILIIILILLFRNYEIMTLKLNFNFPDIRNIFKREKKEKKLPKGKKSQVVNNAPEELIDNDPINVENDVTIKEISKVAIQSKKAEYTVPINLLEDFETTEVTETEAELKRKGKLLEEKLLEFGVEGKIKEIQPGPVVTLYEFEPAPGIKINRIAGLEGDLARAMSAVSVRIIAPIPGKSVVGIELPNKKRATVYLKELINSSNFVKSSSPLTIILGKDISGKPYVSDLGKMPHLLIAGTTGSGKSVCINTIVCSILFKSSPDKVKFVMIDPKMVELSSYEDIPHLAAPVVTDPKHAATVLKNVVAEMENRYEILAEHKVRNIDSFNELASKNNNELTTMPYLVVVVDEFADLMIVAGKEVEQSIIRIAQMARAVGIHLILATQRPSVNVITGIIKANMPARLSFRVSSKTDSRTILDQNGAEILLGRGDSLFIPPGSSDPVRVHGCFVSEKEVSDVVDYLKKLGQPEYNMDLVKEESTGIDEISEDEMDEKYYEALDLVQKKGMASISMIQRYLKIGYNRAARIMEIMEKQGVVAPSDGTSKPREVLIKND
ncbi:DNA translocase FtsK 4TM domain-containing protein [Deferribacterales bacterium Es71-Z0220]|jgi:S-DNA-T family DNA segregation ATPase FtsK/SpoIIIE|uniref:DNA translocase FtsK n=1 Tax=Deferrivibrio essentukiensis TaxID=2880922 RepID=UPI001F6124D2|nr:DNA translocase FtsK [Deferrivibrio essentukiensis]MCB4205329.1 DNA translocase FtsK 4TM domain-containing protein [Deferrivibrio essentukiensis]